MNFCGSIHPCLNFKLIFSDVDHQIYILYTCTPYQTKLSEASKPEQTQIFSFFFTSGANLHLPHVSKSPKSKIYLVTKTSPQRLDFC